MRRSTAAAALLLALLALSCLAEGRRSLMKSQADKDAKALADQQVGALWRYVQGRRRGAVALPYRTGSAAFKIRRVGGTRCFGCVRPWLVHIGACIPRRSPATSACFA